MVENAKVQKWLKIHFVLEDYSRGGQYKFNILNFENKRPSVDFLLCQRAIRYLSQTLHKNLKGPKVKDFFYYAIKKAHTTKEILYIQEA